MGKCTTTTRSLHFDLTDPQVTVVTVEQDYAGDCPLMDRRYVKTFPARVPIIDLFTVEGGIKDYLLWPR